VRRATATLHWGADGKVRQLDQRYPHLHEETSACPLPLPTIGTSVEQLDLGTVDKGRRHAVSGEESCWEKLIENSPGHRKSRHAGAERGLSDPASWRRAQDRGRKPETGRDKVEVQLGQRFGHNPPSWPESLLRYVVRTQESVILE